MNYSVILLTCFAVATAVAEQVCLAGNKQCGEYFPFQVKGQSGLIPATGLGTVSLSDDKGVDAMKSALKAGYRMLDTALLYNNHYDVGKVIKETNIPREELWITSKVGFFPSEKDNDKLWMFNSTNIKGQEIESMELSLEELGLPSVDLCLIHNPTVSTVEYTAASFPHFFELMNYYGSELAIRPGTFVNGESTRDFIMEAHYKRVKEQVDKTKAKEDRVKSWKNMETLHEKGKCRYIGVSNYPPELLKEMQTYATVMPAVNQLELHPLFASPELQAVAKELGMVLVGYGTGTFFQLADQTSQVSVIDNIAKRLGKKPIQIVLRWMYQKGIVSIPRSKSLDHLIENISIFDFSLTEEDVAAVDSLNKDHPFYWDPTPTQLTIA